MDFQSQFLQIGDVQIRYYGIIIVTAMLIATIIAARIAKQSGRDPEHVYGALTWAIIPGIIFARLWFVLFPPASFCAPGVEVCRDTAWFLENFFDTTNGAIAIWSGGLSIFGAVIGGLLGAYIYLRRNKLPVGPWVDMAAIVLPLGQAIGRWANFINQELYGLPTDLPWGLNIPIDIRPEEYRSIEYYNSGFHPLFLYESIWSFIAFLVLFWLWNNRRDMFNAGDFFLLYIAQYSFIRFFLEFIRIEVTYVPGTEINLAQVFTLITFILAIGAFLMRRSNVSDEGYPDPIETEEIGYLQRKSAERAAAAAPASDSPPVESASGSDSD